MIENNDKLTELENILNTISGEHFALVEPGGNHGDKLIYKGLEQKLSELGISKYSTNYMHLLRNDKFAKARRGLSLILNEIGRGPVDVLNLGNPEVIYIHGGGNFSDIWGITKHIFRNVSQSYPQTPIIVGPQTYWFTDTNFADLVKDLHQPIYFFCREEYSHHLLTNQELPDNVSVLKSPDTALYHERDDLLKYIDDSHINYPEYDYNLIAFRDDRESIISPSIIDKIKTEHQNNIVRDISNSDSTTFKQFVSLAEYAERVYTDRLHVGILCSILGTEVELYENIYYKNRGVYKYSLSNVKTTSFNECV